MNALQSGNPAMGALERWDRLEEGAVEKRRVMTLGGTLSATAILLGIVATVGVIVFQKISSFAEASIAAGSQQILPGWAYPALIGSLIGGILFSLIIAFKPKTAPFLAPVHAGIEGVFVGALSVIIPLRFLGGTEVFGGTGVTLVMQAMLATFGICAAMLLGYSTGLLKLGGFAKKLIATMSIGLVLYVAALWILSMFGVGIWNGFADTGIIGIGFTAFCLGLASLYLLLDFEFIEKGIQAGAPKYMEWVGAWGLMVTLVWVYIEVLRLLSKLRSND
ncbi:MAG: Bax inhibitor-1/YccA family protein [Phycisphaerales bacterium]